MAETVLVTGGAGFIGSHLVEALVEQANAVRVLDDLSTGNRDQLPAAIELIEGDVRDRNACARACVGVRTAFHLAARVSVRHSVATFAEDADVNVGGTLRMLQAAAASGVRRFVYASSMAVYADSAGGHRVREEDAAEPLSPYGIGKLTAERYLLLLGPQLGIEPVVLRFFNTFGPRQGYTPYVGVATIFTHRILAGEECVIFGDGQQCRDFTHVSDIVQGCLRAASVPTAAGQVINLGSGIGTTVNELAAVLTRILRAGRFRHQPRDASELRYSVADITKARQLLGYEPRVSLDQGLPQVIQEIRQRLAAAQK